MPSSSQNGNVNGPYGDGSNGMNSSDMHGSNRDYYNWPGQQNRWQNNDQAMPTRSYSSINSQGHDMSWSGRSENPSRPPWQVPSRQSTSMSRPLDDTHIRVKNFNAKEMDWLDFRDYFVQVADKANWSDNTRCVKLLAALDSGLLGVTNDLGSNYTFEQLILKLDHVNGADFARREAKNKLDSVKRKEGESLAFFAERIRRLVNRGYPYYSMEARDEQALKAFVQGLPTKQEFRLRMKLMNFQTLHEAVNYGSNLDQVLKEERYSSGLSRMVGIGHDDDSDDGDSVEEGDLESLRKTHDRLGKKLHKFDRRFGNNDRNRFQRGHFEHRNHPQGSAEKPVNSDTKPCPTCGHDKAKPEFKPRVTGRCFQCNEPGHWAQDCPSADNAVVELSDKNKDLSK